LPVTHRATRRKPVVAAASTGPAELITAGENGLLVPIDDVEALAAGMSRIAGDKALAQALASCGHQSFEAQFTEQRVVAAYRAFIAKVAA
jgi:glycosyltransferase involved in cell wall biosynthesis